MTKRFIDYIVADYELPTPLFKRSNKTISPHVSTKQMSAQLEVHTHVKRTLCKRSLFECNAIATLFNCSSCSKKDFANQQALAQDIKVRKDIKNSQLFSLCNQTLNIQNVRVSAVLISTCCLTSTRDLSAVHSNSNT